MAAPATYIRTIHSSLTSASAHHSHHSSSAWASASASASASAGYHLNHGHHHLHSLTSNPNPNPNPASLAGAPLVTGGHPLPYHHLSTPRSNQVTYTAQGLMHTPSISTHNAHMYTHHLRDLTHPGGSPSPSHSHHRASGAQGPVLGTSHPTPNPFVAGISTADAGLAQAQQHVLAPRRNPPSPPPHSRRRSASIRMPPSYRFDPFGDVDESLPLPAGFASSRSGGGGGGVSSLRALPSSSAQVEVSSASRSAPTEAQTEAAEQEDDIASAASEASESPEPSSSYAPNQPYTIQIPPAAPLEIQQYTCPPPLPRTPSPSPRALPPSSRPSSPILASTPVPKLSSNVSALGLTYAPTAPPNYYANSNANPNPNPNPFPSPNLSKIVAGIMLNRVHAPKPMKRRIVGAGNGGNGARQYVKSCLSSVVSVEV